MKGYQEDRRSEQSEEHTSIINPEGMFLLAGSSFVVEDLLKSEKRPDFWCEVEFNPLPCECCRDILDSLMCKVCISCEQCIEIVSFVNHHGCLEADHNGMSGLGICKAVIINENIL